MRRSLERNTSAKTAKQKEFIRKIKAERGRADSTLEDEGEFELHPDAQEYWDAFQYANTQRGHREADGAPISLPIVEIKALSDILLVNAFDLEFFMAVLISLDHQYCTYKTDLIEKEKKRQAQRNKNR